jgi:hypothetical protein
MSHPKERFHDFAVTNEGDVVPLEDYDDLPVANESITQGMDNLNHARHMHAIENSDEFKTDAKHTREQAVIDQGLQDPGVYVTLEERYQDELDLMNLVSGANMRGGKKRGVPGGFEVAHRTHPEILDRYGPQLPNVAEGARRNHRRMVNRDTLDIYHAAELKEAGIGDKEEVDFDARTMMPNAYRNRYYGTKEKDDARRVRRKYLKKMIAYYATK